MINNLLFPDIIERIDDGINERQYQASGKTFSSVNQVISYHEPKDFLIRWKQKVGEEAAKQIGQTAAADGSKLHKCAECYFTKEELPELNTRQKQLYKQLTPFLTEVVTECMAQELKIRYFQKLNIHGHKDPEGMDCSVGGTFDSLAKLITTKLVNDYGECPFENPEEIFMIDYKSQSKKKNPLYMIRHYLQLSLYSGGFNQLTNCEHRVNKGLIVAVTSRGLYLYYIDPRMMAFYWENALEMLAGYFYKRKVNWEAFSKIAEGYWYDGSQWVFNLTHEDYLPQQLYLKR